MSQYFDSIDWTSGSDLQRCLMNYIGVNEKSKKPVEIERKWVIDPSAESWFMFNTESYRIRYINSVYIDSNPEARVRSYYDRFRRLEGYKVTCKGIASADGLCRTELESPCTSRVWHRAIDVAISGSKIRRQDAILKMTFIIAKIGGITYEFKSMDDGKECQLEIEFPNVTAARAFVLPEGLRNLATDVTSDPEHKLINYWNRTRGVTNK